MECGLGHQMKGMMDGCGAVIGGGYGESTSKERSQ